MKKGHIEKIERKRVPFQTKVCAVCGKQKPLFSVGEPGKEKTICKNCMKKEGKIKIIKPKKAVTRGDPLVRLFD